MNGVVNLPALMRLDDRSFVEHAYAALLGRAADESGLQAQVVALQAGRSRILTLGGLRYSPEGKQVGMTVPWLRLRYLLHRLYGVRVVGRMLRTLTSIIALPSLVQEISRMWRDLHAIQTAGKISSAATAQDAATRVALSEAAMRSVHQRLDQLAVSLNQLHAHAGGEPWADPVLTLAERLDRQSDRISRSEQAISAAVVSLNQLDAHAGGEPWADPVLTLAERLDRQSDRISRNEQAVAAAAETKSSLDEAAKLVAALRLRFGWEGDETAFAQEFEALLVTQRNLAARAISAAEEAQTRLHDQERRLSLILTDVRKLTAEGVPSGAPGAALERILGQQDAMLDALYVSFEDRFRGSRADVKRRQSIYLDQLRYCGAGTADRPIVDVGSGRGELLELLSEAGLQARGVDLSEVMVACCTRAGLDAVHGDAVAYVSGLEPGSLGAVTGFHIIEHLPFPVMVALLDASLRALAPGGIIIFETPNPANLLTASRWFYLDPTHRNPLPGEMVAMIAEARGFTEVSIRELHPMERRFEAKDDVLAGQLDAIFHGPQDYALIARKP